MFFNFTHSWLYTVAAYLEILTHVNVFFCVFMYLYMLSQSSLQACCGISIVHPRYVINWAKPK